MQPTMRTTRWFLPLLVLGVLGLAACGDDEPTSSAPTTTTTAPATTDGTHAGRLVAVTASTITFDPAVLLSGDEAVEAAREDGALPPDGELPNDFYLDDDEAEESTLPLAPGATVELYDCTAGCELGTVDTADFVSGAVAPYGGEHALVELDVVGGEIVTVRELYLP